MFKRTFQALDAHAHSDPTADGIVAEDRFDYDAPPKEAAYEVRRLPELGPTRRLRRVAGEPLVLPIRGRRFIVRIEDDNDRGEVPEPGRVTFEETDLPETPFTVWDPKAEMEAAVARSQAQLAKYDQILTGTSIPPSVRTEMEADKRRAERRLARDMTALAVGDCNYHPRGDVAFGQPVFVQGEVYPALDGKAAFHLITLDTGWGDCGNENYMVALDDDGFPVAVFHEASCS